MTSRRAPWKPGRHAGLGIALVTAALAGCVPSPDAAPGLDQETTALAQAVADPAMLTYHPDLQVKLDEMIHRATGVLYRDLRVGTGDSLTTGRVAVVRYGGWLPDGTLFDTNRQDDLPPFSFRVGAGEVIEGWDDGLLGMQAGGIRKLIIPYQMGYGEMGSGPIPPYATLVFDVELLEIR